jgi:hypothetical protein
VDRYLFDADPDQDVTLNSAHVGKYQKLFFGLLFIAVTVYIVFFHVNDIIISNILNIINFPEKINFSFWLKCIPTDPDRQTLDAEPDPQKDANPSGSTAF